MRGLIEGYVAIARKLEWLGLLLFRAIWGYAIFVAGKGKLVDIDTVASNFDALGIFLPKANAYLAACAETFGGLLLIAGLCTRLACLPLLFTMLVAYLLASASEVSDFDTFLAAAPVPYGLAFLLLLATGPGKASLDHLLFRSREPRL